MLTADRLLPMRRAEANAPADMDEVRDRAGGRAPVSDPIADMRAGLDWLRKRNGQLTREQLEGRAQLRQMIRQRSEQIRAAHGNEAATEYLWHVAAQISFCR